MLVLQVEPKDFFRREVELQRSGALGKFGRRAGADDGVDGVRPCEDPGECHLRGCRVAAVGQLTSAGDLRVTSS